MVRSVTNTNVPAQATVETTAVSFDQARNAFLAKKVQEAPVAKKPMPAAKIMPVVKPAVHEEKASIPSYGDMPPPQFSWLL